MKKQMEKNIVLFSKIVRSKIPQDKKTSSEVTPTPSTNQNQEVSENKSFQTIFVKVSQISDNEISLISETSANEYI